MLEDAGVPSGLYNWEPRRGAENSMWDELIPPLFIQRPVWRCFLISASVCAQRSGSIHLWVGGGWRWDVGKEDEREGMSILDLQQTFL